MQTSNRYGHRDATMILLAFRHGLRAVELVDLQWSQIDFTAAVLHVRRVKKGTASTHPLRGDEMRALRKLQRESAASSFVFVSERGSPFSTAGFAKMVERAGVQAGFDFKAHPHMLRHACGFALANAGHDTRAFYLLVGAGGNPVGGLRAAVILHTGICCDRPKRARKNESGRKGHSELSRHDYSPLLANESTWIEKCAVPRTHEC